MDVPSPELWGIHMYVCIHWHGHTCLLIHREGMGVIGMVMLVYWVSDVESMGVIAMGMLVCWVMGNGWVLLPWSCLSYERWGFNGCYCHSLLSDGEWMSVIVMGMLVLWVMGIGWVLLQWACLSSIVVWKGCLAGRCLTLGSRKSDDCWNWLNITVMGI